MLTLGKIADPNDLSQGVWGSHAPWRQLFGKAIPAPGLCLLGEFLEQPCSRTPGGGTAVWPHPRPPPLHVTPTGQSAAASRSAGAREPRRRARESEAAGTVASRTAAAKALGPGGRSKPSGKLQPPQVRLSSFPTLPFGADRDTPRSRRRCAWQQRGN